MGIFRVVKQTNYTVMSNYHLRDKDLSLKAKGLLSQMLSLPDDWDYTTRGLAAINRECKDTICGVINELIQAGYIVRTQSQGESGRFNDIVYDIYEFPVEVKDPDPDERDRKKIFSSPDQETGGLNYENNSMKNNTDNKSENPGSLEDSGFPPCPKNPDTVNPDTETSDSNEIKNNKINNNKSVSQSDMKFNNTSVDFKKISDNADNPASGKTEEDSEGKPDRRTDRVTDKKSSSSNAAELSPEEVHAHEQKYKSIIRKQISYDRLLSDFSDKEHGQEIVDEAADLIFDMCFFPHDDISLKGRTYSWEIIRSQFFKLDYKEVSAVLKRITEHNFSVKNMPKYLISAFYFESVTKNIDKASKENPVMEREVRNKDSPVNPNIHNFSERNYDMKSLEREILENQRRSAEKTSAENKQNSS